MVKFITFLLIFSNVTYSQEDLEAIEDTIQKDKVLVNLNNESKPITLNDAIEEGLRKNNSEVLRKYEFQINEINYKDAHEDFYLPKLNLTMSTSSDHYTENLYRDNIQNAQSSKTPTGYVGLEMPDYTLFNWGRDFLTYLNSKETYERNKQIYKEKRRELRFEIITNYFNLARLRKISQIYKKQLSHTSFIYKLAKEKLSLKKIRTQEYLQAKAQFLNSHSLYQSALYDFYAQQQVLANLIGDNLETIYKPISQLKFHPMTLGANEALKHIAQSSPNVKSTKSLLKNANRSYEKALKDNMPLPKLSLKLGTYKKNFSSGGVEDTYETFSGSRNLEVAASVNMTWTIFGSGGLFNSRTTEKSYYRKRIAEINYRDSLRETKVANNLTHSRIIYLEKKVKAITAQLKNARKVFDYAIDNYIGGKTSFADLKDVLEEILNASISIENVKYRHLVEKITYASLLGIDDFPGEKFENLVLK